MTRVGLVGYGDAGRGIHAPLLRRAGLEVSVVQTANPARVAAARDELPDAAVVPDLDAVLASSPDVVVLASPSGVHVSQGWPAWPPVCRWSWTSRSGPTPPLRGDWSRRPSPPACR